jgi:hypothetical protein
VRIELLFVGSGGTRRGACRIARSNSGWSIEIRRHRRWRSCRGGADRPLTSERYTLDYREVMLCGSATSTDRPQDRTDVAWFFAAASAAYAWNTAAQQVSDASGLSLAENARAFALLNMAVSDALVASMETKYHYVFWRPVTAIRAGDLDTNPETAGDAAWTPWPHR